MIDFPLWATIAGWAAAGWLVIGIVGAVVVIAMIFYRGWP